MPTVDILFGIAEMRTPPTPRARAISSERLVILLSLTPISSSISYLVTDGPFIMLDIVALTPKD